MIIFPRKKESWEKIKYKNKLGSQNFNQLKKKTRKKLKKLLNFDLIKKEPTTEEKKTQKIKNNIEGESLNIRSKVLIGSFTAHTRS